MRTEDLHNGIVEGEIVPFLRITPVAGSEKTGNYRIVPVHPQLQEMGLCEMITSLPAGPIFYSMETKGRAADALGRARNAGTKVLNWIRDGVRITDPRIQPNQAWRHRFKTIARDTDMHPEYRDAIQGQEDERAASDYGETTIKAFWREIQKMPRWEIAGV